MISRLSLRNSVEAAAELAIAIANQKAKWRPPLEQ
jgi:hypothetical protein